ncbi:MAG: hypothetical protein J3R72DRAFT_452762 [Linnemannia gamsii]|nr:MAG: hypothetical protein J3R72DRAFT_452762 [Linnemannia gamsii]
MTSIAMTILTTPSNTSSRYYHENSTPTPTSSWPSSSPHSPNDPFPTASYYTPRKLTPTLAMVLLIGAMIILFLCLIVCVSGYIRYRKRMQLEKLAALESESEGDGGYGGETVMRVVVVAADGRDGGGGGREGKGGDSEDGDASTVKDAGLVRDIDARSDAFTVDAKGDTTGSQWKWWNWRS